MKDQYFSSFIRFQCILHDSAILFKFPQIKKGGIVFLGWRGVVGGRGHQFCETAELFVPPPPLYFILKIWSTEILCHSLDFNAFYMITEYFSQFLFKFLKIKEREPNLLGRINSVKRLNYLVAPSLFQF